MEFINLAVLSESYHGTTVPQYVRARRHIGGIYFTLPFFHYFLQQYIKEILFRYTMGRFHDYVH